ncbi:MULTISPECIES: bifunctional diguanylate cyclase/phosphodiesterase [unclassified Tardiphaga]|uniref:bifunctional diguanylate cyclase/phosphodiesterase n=1 Tax=unclassified Tardiphaga TaxID=2631404 RepID=UPI001164D672|nr:MULTISPECIES: EAL domain-containing protein [unclassified Tardiphaga]QDM17357.1 EAL domain-containing protein [Tardiphaga sp. vice278]QDM22330.1 EAL domain-containing protein [Tardiphaga sp. vice154]
MEISADNLAVKPVQWKRYTPAILAAVVGTLIALGASFAVSSWESRLDELKLQEIAEDYRQTLNSSIENATNILFTLRANYSSADRPIGRTEFQAYAKDLRSRLPGLRNTGWAPHVTRQQRAAFEQAVREEGFADFEIWERDEKGNRIRARDRDEFLPILFPDPQEYTKQIIGFDMYSEPIRAHATARARLTGRPSATPPINLITKEEPDGFMAFVPVYPKFAGPHDPQRIPDGFMYGVFGTAPMIENILGAKTLPAGLDIYFLNPKAPAGQRGIFWYPSRTRLQPAAAPTEDSMRAARHWSGQIRIADQEWTAIFAPTGELAGGRLSWQAIIVFGVGLLITAMIIIYLLVSLKRTVRLERLTGELREATAKLQRESVKVTRLASLDSMTGLANRATFSARLAETFAAARRDDRHFAVFCLDLDHFKEVNDTLGHPSGDLLLQIVAERLRAVVGIHDLIARLGGDEFAILVVDASDRPLLASIAARIRNALKRRYDLDGEEAQVSASLGISIYDTETASPDAMLVEADLALYQTKHDGRDGYSFYSTSLERKARDRLAMSEEIRAAIANDELEVYYQPQVEISSGRIVGMEALLRWNHPQRGLLLPASFLPIAVTTGAIHSIGQWVLEQVCQQIGRWQREGIDPPRLAISISAAQLKVVNTLDEQIRETAARYAIDPGRIEIELTEAALIESNKIRTDIIPDLQALGISVAIDDFGIGYSLLALLRTHPLDRLKIARQFMPNLLTEPGDAAIVRAALVLAREFGMEAIAEGVETADQLAFLLSAGCRFAQGSYFSRPVPADEASALLQAGSISRPPAAKPADSVRLLVG